MNSAPEPAPSLNREHPPVGTFSVTAHTRDHATVLSVAGEVDVATVSHLARAITSCLQTHPPVFVVDLTGVTFLASAGLQALVEARQAGGTSTAIRVVANQRAVLRPIQLTSIDRVVPIYPDVDKALSAV